MGPVLLLLVCFSLFLCTLLPFPALAALGLSRRLCASQGRDRKRERGIYARQKSRENEAVEESRVTNNCTSNKQPERSVPSLRG